MHHHRIDGRSHLVTHSCRHHFLHLTLCRCELESETQGPISEYDHRAINVIVLHVNYMKSDNFAFMQLAVVFRVYFLVWVNDVIETVLFSVNECILNRNWLALLDRTDEH